MIQYFLPPKASQLEVVNTKVFLTLLFFSSFFCVAVSFLDFGDETPYLMIGVLNLVLIYLFYYTKSTVLIGNIFLLIWFLFLGRMSLETGGIYSMDAFCLVLAPLIAFSLLGRTSGVLWLLGMMFFSLSLWSLARPPEQELYFKAMTEGFNKDYYLAAHFIFIIFFTAIFYLISHHYNLLVQQLSAKKQELSDNLQLLQQQSKLLEQSKKELKRSNIELEEYANATSHDLKQPIRNVHSFATLLEKHLIKEDKLDKRSGEMLGFITEGSNRMLTLITDLLDFAKLKSDKEIVFKEKDLESVVTSVLFNLQNQIKETGTTIQVNSLPKALVIPVKLGQVFQNLLSNAIKFRKKDTPLVIQISAIDRKDHIQIKIEDNGIGIEKEFQEKVFAPFKKLHAQRDYAGSGVGLATCKHIIELHLGRIWVESEFGRGSTFYFTLSKLLNTPNVMEGRMIVSNAELN